MGEWIQGNWGITVGIQFGLWLVTTVLVIVYIMKLISMKRSYNKMMNSSGVDQLEQVITQMQDKIAQAIRKNDEQDLSLAKLRSMMKTMKSHVGIQRYNAFTDQGSDLSFSLAIIDESQDGIVLSGLHNREETYVYAKPLDKGESKYPLSPEEKEAINQALKQK